MKHVGMVIDRSVSKHGICEFKEDNWHYPIAAINEKRIYSDEVPIASDSWIKNRRMANSFEINNIKRHYT